MCRLLLFAVACAFLASASSVGTENAEGSNRVGEHLLGIDNPNPGVTHTHSEHPVDLQALRSALQGMKGEVDRLQNIIHNAEHFAQHPTTTNVPVIQPSDVASANLLKRNLQQQQVTATGIYGVEPFDPDTPPTPPLPPMVLPPYNFEGCYWNGYQTLTTGQYVGTYTNVPVYKQCQLLCMHSAVCGWWVWVEWQGGTCYLQGYGSVMLVDKTSDSKHFVSGPKTCPNAPPTQYPTESPTLPPPPHTGFVPYNLDGCYWDRWEAVTTQVSGPYEKTLTNIGTHTFCQQLCFNSAVCGWFVWADWQGGTCHMKGRDTVTLVDQTKSGRRFISGPKICPILPTTTRPPVTLPPVITTTTTTRTGTIPVSGQYTNVPAYVSAGSSGTLRYAAYTKGYLVGAAISLDRLSDQEYTAFAAAEFNMLVPENACKPNQPQAGCDQLYDLAAGGGQAFRFHALLGRNLFDSTVPQMTPEQKRQWIQTSVAAKVRRYADRTIAFDVVNEVIADNQDSAPAEGWTMRQYEFYPSVPDHVDIAFFEAKKNVPAGWQGKLCINDYLVESLDGVDSHVKKANALFDFVRDMRRRGVPVDCVGFQMHKSLARDFTDTFFNGIGPNIARYRDIGIEVQFTEVDWACGYFESGGSNFVQCANAGGWSEAKAQQQAVAYGRLAEICRQYENCKVFAMWGFYDPQSWLANDHPLLLNADYSKKPAYFAMLSEFQK